MLKSVTGSTQAAAIIQEDMDEGEQVINSSLLYNVIENGVIEPKYQQYEQVMSLYGFVKYQRYSWKTGTWTAVQIFQK